MNDAVRLAIKLPLCCLEILSGFELSLKLLLLLCAFLLFGRLNLLLELLVGAKDCQSLNLILELHLLVICH